ncbi:cytochrome P450 monooxygenase [Xylariaceae sp. FL1651]|nr:cytochrome P450 monooxygenase [Xylariaceae sp. FL1651]
MATDNLALETSPSTALVTAAALGCVGAVFLLYYHVGRPKPYPGIPYIEASARSFFGDTPGLMAHIKQENGTFITYLEKVLRNLDAPMVQVFTQPWNRPMIVLSDFREARDIMTRRAAEFDRATSAADLLAGLVPDHHIHMKTLPRWRAHRRLIQDLMSPGFLHNVAGPALHESALLLVDLWRVKSRIAAGRPWTTTEDIDHAAVDSVLVFTFGEAFGQRHSATRSALEELKEAPAEDRIQPESPSSSDEPIAFRLTRADEVVRATLDLIACGEEVQGSPMPPLKWYFVNRKPHIKRARQIKESFVRSELEDAVRRLRASTNDESQFVKSAVDHMVFREAKIAEKESRKPVFFSRTMMDEVFGFVVAGGDTTSTSVAWGLKYLADNPAVQSRLRTALETSFDLTSASESQPTLRHITDSHISYLDAVMEETLRCSSSVPVVDREALIDTEVLGHHIPKGSIIKCLVVGPSMTSPAFNIDEKRRNGGGLASKPEPPIRSWDPDGMAAFNPERWLVGKDGAFDPKAGPQLAFGLGPRSCYGKRLAYLEFRILITLIVWNFELLPCPPALSSYKNELKMTNRPKDSYVRLRSIDR